MAYLLPTRPRSPWPQHQLPDHPPSQPVRLQADHYAPLLPRGQKQRHHHHHQSARHQSSRAMGAAARRGKGHRATGGQRDAPPGRPPHARGLGARGAACASLAACTCTGGRPPEEPPSPKLKPGRHTHRPAAEGSRRPPPPAREIAACTHAPVPRTARRTRTNGSNATLCTHARAASCTPAPRLRLRLRPLLPVVAAFCALCPPPLFGAGKAHNVTFVYFRSGGSHTQGDYRWRGWVGGAGGAGWRRAMAM